MRSSTNPIFEPARKSDRARPHRLLTDRDDGPQSGEINRRRRRRKDLWKESHLLAACFYPAWARVVATQKSGQNLQFVLGHSASTVLRS